MWAVPRPCTSSVTWLARFRVLQYEGGASRVVRDASVQLASSTRFGRFGELALRCKDVSASWEEVEDEGEGLPGEFFGFLKQLPIQVGC